MDRPAILNEGSLPILQQVEHSMRKHCSPAVRRAIETAVAPLTRQPEKPLPNPSPKRGGEKTLSPPRFGEGLGEGFFQSMAASCCWRFWTRKTGRAPLLLERHGLPRPSLFAQLDVASGTCAVSPDQLLADARALAQ